MGRLMSRFLDFLGFESVPAEGETEEHGGRVVAEPGGGKSGALKVRDGNIISIYQNRPIKVTVSQVSSFNESQLIADHLKNHRAVVLNLESADRVLAQRVVDFIAGTAYALGGSIQKVSTGTYLAVAGDVEVASLAESLPGGEPWVKTARDPIPDLVPGSEERMPFWQGRSRL